LQQNVVEFYTGGGASANASGTYGNLGRMLGLGQTLEEDRIEVERDGSVFDLSKLTGPEFGKVDPDNAPHIGGNTWAGGVGGYNTVSLRFENFMEK
jgi:hypothetical protein